MSGAEVPYHLRQNKHVDRQLFMELLSHVDRFMPIKDMLYVSFGGIYFEDHKLLHNLFGGENLVSIERQDWVYVRQQANRPFGCIRCINSDSRKFIDSLSNFREEYGGSAIIFWLDYAAAAERLQQLEEFTSLLKVSNERDVIRITLNANPNQLAARDTGESIASLNKRRLMSLEETLGDKLPSDVEPADLTNARFAKLLQTVVKLEAARALRSRPEVFFRPLATYSYADSEHTMLTVTGIVLREQDMDEFERATGLATFGFGGLNWELIHVNVPLLSAREKLLLDQEYKAGIDPAAVAQKLGFQVADKPKESLARLKAYFDFHRFYPHFHRIQY